MEITLTPTPKQHLAWQAWDNNLVDDIIFGGGAGSGKSRWESEAIAITALRYPDTRHFIGRKELKSLMQTTFVTMTQIVFPSWGLENGKHWSFNGQRHEIEFYNGSKINLLHLGHLPSDPLYDRLGSHEYTTGGIDEMSEIEFRAYDVLRSRVGRYNNSKYNLRGKLAGTLNPSQEWPYRLFYDPWKKADRPDDPSKPLVSMRGMLDGEEVVRTFVFIQALVGDNPHIEQQYKINLATISDPVLRARLQAGDWEFASAADILFEAAGIADLFTVAAPRSNEQYLTVDVARFGGDRIVLNYWKGWRSWKIDLHAMLPIHETAEKVRTALSTYGIPREHVLIDADGIGGGVVDLLPGCLSFSGAAAPFGTIGETKTRERYRNLRTQCIYHLAEKVRNRQVSVTEPSIEARELLAADLMQFKRRNADKEGKLEAAKKEDMKSALGRSPDVGDTMVMRSYFDLRLREQALGTGHMSVYIPD